MLENTIIYNDTSVQSFIKDSTLYLTNRIELIIPDSSEKLFFGLPIEFTSIIIPTMITIIIFGLGLFFQWRNKKNDRLLDLISFKTVIVEWTKLTENTIAIQYSLYQDFRMKLDLQENILPISFFNESFLIDKLEKLELRELIDLMVINQEGNRKLNALTLLNIVSEIHKLSSIEIDIKDKYNEYLNYTRLLMDQWNSNYNLLTNYILNLPLKTANSKNENEAKFYDSIRQTYDLFRTSLTTNITTKSTIKELISPIESICDDFIKSDHTFTEPYSIRPTLMELLLIEYRWLIYKNGIIKYFEDTENKTKATYNMLKKNIEILEKMKFKKWNKIH